MKRILGIAAVLAALSVGRAEAEVLNSLTKVFYIPPGGDCTVVACTNGSRQMCRDSSTGHTIYACDTSTGFYVAVGSGAVDPGGHLSLSGVGGSTYLTLDPDTGCVREYQSGTLTWQFCSGYVVPPPCVATRPRPLGGYCRDTDPTTSDSRVLMQTGKGLIDVATGKVVIR